MPHKTPIAKVILPGFITSSFNCSLLDIDLFSECILGLDGLYHAGPDGLFLSKV